MVDATEGCRVLDVAKALSITVGGANKVVDKVEAQQRQRGIPSVGRTRQTPEHVNVRSSPWS